MKAYNINCPNCGGNINLEKDNQRCFCPYCGSQVLIDDGVQRSEVIYRDEAKILELQLQEQTRLRAVEDEQNAAWRAPSGSLSTMFQAGALIELSGDESTAYKIYFDTYDIHELPPLE